MSAVLTYHVRAGQLHAVAAGKVFHLPTHADRSRVASWEKVQELRAGKHTLWDHCFEPPVGHMTGSVTGETVIRRLSLGSASPGAARAGLYDWPGEYAQRFDGVENRPAGQHSYSGSAVYVGDARGGLYIHGWPPCNLKRCVVVMQGWDDLLRAVASEPALSFAIVF